MVCFKRKQDNRPSLEHRLSRLDGGKTDPVELALRPPAWATLKTGLPTALGKICSHLEKGSLSLMDKSVLGHSFLPVTGWSGGSSRTRT